MDERSIGRKEKETRQKDTKKEKGRRKREVVSRATASGTRA